MEWVVECGGRHAALGLSFRRQAGYRCPKGVVAPEFLKQRRDWQCERLEFEWKAPRASQYPRETPGNSHNPPDAG